MTRQQEHQQVRSILIRSKCASFAVVVCLVAGSLVIATTPVFAQTVVNPIIVTFAASSDQDATTSSGAPLLTSYELEFYMSGATQPFQTVGLGKPTPDGSNAITVNFATLLSPVPPLGVVYAASVAAVGPGGRSSSPLSVDTFSFTGGTSPCTFGVSPAGILVPGTGGIGSATVTAPSGCTWTASGPAGWLSITGGASGSGTGTISYTAAANMTASAKSMTIIVAGKAVPVTEAAQSPAIPQGLRVTTPGS
jgi:hypothetical protein